MSLPRVKFKKVDGQTGVARPGADGVLAIIAPSSIGTVNQPQAYTDANVALVDKGYGMLVSAFAHVVDEAGNPCVLVKANATTNGTYSAITKVGTGTSVATADGSAHPVDDFGTSGGGPVTIIFPTGGTIGVTGITYQVALDGTNFGPVTALGTANNIAIANTGIQIDLGAGTIVANDTLTFTTTGPRMVQADLDAALLALKTYGGPWEAVLILGLDMTSTLVGDIDSYLSGLETNGKFKSFVANTAVKTSGQSESAYATAMTTAAASMASIRGVVAADSFDTADPIWGCTVARPAALAVASRGMAIPVSVDCARVADGALQNATIVDARNNPVHHDEQNYPGLDDIRLATLRTIPGKGSLAYITNPLLISAPGSDYVFWQHARVMNKACEFAFQLLTDLLSSGVASSGTHISEGDAQAIEGHVSSPLRGLMAPHVSDIDFILHRDDDISSNAGAKVTSDIEIVTLKYIKEFDVNAKFVSKLTRSITVGG